MTEALQALYEQMDFVSISNFKKSERFELQNLDSYEDWDSVYCKKLSLKKDLPSNISNKSFCLILEFVKQGAKEGYLLISMPVLVDIPDEADRKGVFLNPDSSEAVSLNSEYYLQEKQDGPPVIQMNDQPFSQDNLFELVNVGVSKSYFEKAKHFLYKSANVTSFEQLEDKIKEQLKYQNIYPKFSLVERASDASKIQLLELYKGLISDGHEAYASTCLPRLLSVYEGLNDKSWCKKDDVYNNFLNLSPGKYDITQPYLLGHMDVQNQNLSSSSLLESRELFPLDNTQRHASLAAAYLDVGYQNDLSLGRILSVNGPPGSGKTSMLKAVVAHYVVRAALLKEPCPIIVASGATNQSVKNVTSAFPDVVQSEHDSNLLYCQRWIPNCDTYGSFYASNNAIDKLTESEKSSIPILKNVGIDKPYNFKWEGLGSELNELNDNDRLSEYYINKAKSYFNQLSLSPPSDVEGVVAKLHNMLLIVYKDMANAVYVARKQLLSGNGDTTRVFPIQNENEHLKNFILAREELVELYETDNPKIYEKICREIIRDEQISIEDYVVKLRKTAILLLIEHCVDLEYRTRLFHLAARYWEGRYILDQISNLHFTRTESNIIEGLRRVCMITPVIISTINRLPSLLKINSYTPGSLRNDFVYGGIDLLITDESGQSTISGGAPLAGLTKRLVSVGDVMQLAPVLGDKEVTAFDEFFIWAKNGFSQRQITAFFKDNHAVTNGSFLHLVQSASSVNYQGDGFMLRGHYRCYQNIIEFCNRLVYDNKLFYLPHLNNNLVDEGLPAMAYVESKGSSTVGGSGKSKQNINEAELIAQMVVSRYAQWQALLGRDSQKPALQDMVAIITPFNQQPKVIKDALIAENKIQGLPISEDEINNTVINTIHTLQGAEKDIVIYSGVQSKDDNEKLFFEEQPYLLNVAISRAKKSFIAFLSPELYRLSDEAFINNTEPKISNSIHFLGWYMYNFGERLFPNYLFVVEAPGKKTTLESILKENYLVYATGGAITNLALEDSSVDTATKQLRPNYQLKANGRDAIDKIISEGGKVEKIYLATDDDNVGETISWHLYHNLKKEAPEFIEKIERVPLRNITHEGVFEAITNARDIDLNKVSAEIVRDIVDKWIAQNMYELLKDKLPRSMGMGRVMASILDVVARYEDEAVRLQNTSLNVHMDVNERKLDGTVYNVSSDVMEKIKEKITNSEIDFFEAEKKYRLISSESVKISYPPPSRSTYVVLALAWKLYGIKPDVTMRVLQRLYEGNI